MRKIRENIYTLFGYELFVGVVAFGAILLLGKRGLAALSLMALLPVLYWKRHIDEREIFLFYYKVGNFTAIAVIVTMVFFRIIFPSIDCIGALALSYFAIHGLSGLIVFSRG